MRKLAQKVKRDLRLACPALMNTASDIRQLGLPLTISKGLLFAPLTLPIQPDFFHSLGILSLGFKHALFNSVFTSSSVRLFFSFQCINSYKIYIDHL